ncbi:histidine phosphatase family protein [Peribacillus deserti]|uniref:Histidine phosphatase family protein n=1 Tax=Peribacillus deserti TaxID=673318 RepID=A0A2N5M1R2_9BACI|nr:histidine phosphatase family protein [Peribacillus deserti]PLT28245.1 histidine phosphatase family protein [Peribacillus deserti]
MNKKIYLVRHAKAEGQPFESPLTELGRVQGEKLVQFFDSIPIDRVISSPFTRAIETIDPLARERGLKVEIDDRLSERVLSSAMADNWQELLRASFLDMESTLEGGESNISGLKRVQSLLEEITASDHQTIVLVSHGNLSTLLLHHFDKRYGFEDLMKMSNPDVFEISISADSAEVRRIWQD